MMWKLSDDGVSEQEIQRIISNAKADGKEWFEAYDSEEQQQLE